MTDGTPYNGNYGKELGSTFLGKDGKIHNDEEIFRNNSGSVPGEELPDSKKKDQELKENFIDNNIPKNSAGQPVINPFSISGSTQITPGAEIKKNKEAVMNPLKLVFAIVALILAFVFQVILPGSSLLDIILPIVSAAASACGMVNWRTQFDMEKAWFQSKTIIGSLLVVLPIIFLIVINFFSFGIPAWIISALTALIGLGGGTTLWGIFDVKNSTAITK